MITWNSGFSAKLLFNPKTWGFHFFTEGGPDGYGFQFWFLVLHFTFWREAIPAISEEDIAKSYCCDATVTYDYLKLKPGETLDDILSDPKREPIYQCSACGKQVNRVGGKFFE